MTVLERRLAAEWKLLLALVALNPNRLHDPVSRDTTFFITLRGPLVERANQSAGQPISSHDIRIEYPVHFPAVPMELYLHTPVMHINVHPDTGFVCLWERHRVSHTVEHALHKTAAMLAGRLYNAATPHVMQPRALGALQQTSMPPDPGEWLRGVEYAQPWLDSMLSTPATIGRKSRLT